MLHRIQKYFAGIKPVYIDGGLYVALAFLGAILITFSSDDVYKYSPWGTAYKSWPVLVYWIKTIDEWIIAGLTAIKMYRSTAFADHVNAQQGNVIVPKPAKETLTPNTIVQQPAFAPNTEQKPTQTVENKL